MLGGGLLVLFGGGWVGVALAKTLGGGMGGGY